MRSLSSCLAAACLAFMVPSAAKANAEAPPFVGTWDCGVAVFTFTDNVYDNGSEDLPIRHVETGADGAYTLVFDEDYRITLSGFTGKEMGWYSHASGDDFDCTRITAR
ncbi:hypothetical protein U0C82_04425 [Fulvimarina sp. 2208YS6-2-32]|uniref:Uncharacterized protein n=1 Tax=Fulvimarina uroteuthidis TaxID=3098149 RepID=A0ABU5I0V7_9HYPH|nr:hypothetical protein [Fulvimarina sp. 2208YS6-2-32]MDY8108398.1 hypothetical protein [Fulvimarina sp. 2208YS6-2-32]